jgi:hypothetical protein
MKKIELRQIIKEEISKVLDKSSRNVLKPTLTNESLLKIRYRGSNNQEFGTVDTSLIDELLNQIGPYIGYPDWEDRIQNPDYKGIIQKLAKDISGIGTLGMERLDIK